MAKDENPQEIKQAANKTTSGKDHPGVSRGYSPVPVVAIGASAGGLEPIEEFFVHLEKGLGFAYIVVQHLSPDFKSLMPEILRRKTKLPIYTITDQIIVKPDTIYLLPPRQNLLLSGNRLILQNIVATRMPNKPIDLFFHSLSQAIGEDAVGIILSGTGSDGTLGIKTIRDVGGTVIVQDPATCKFDGMPVSAISTKQVDFTLAPEKIPKILSQLSQNRKLGKKNEKIYDPSEGVNVKNHSGDDLMNIFQLIEERYGVDFNKYKVKTVHRRLERRIEFLRKESLEKYAEYLESNPKEVTTLYYEMLIGVTEFFRDEVAFKIVDKDVIPKIIQQKKDNEEIRVWVAGCASGEEAYSLAILFLEHIERSKKTLRFKIFATDVDDEILSKASEGVFSSDNLNVMESRLLAKYFTAGKNNKYHIKKEVRKHIVFARHNLLVDPPFTKIDLITCRNLLIYFNETAQQQAQSVMFFSLKPTGYLFLGPSETLGKFVGGYEPVNQQWRIFQKSRDRLLPKEVYQFAQNPSKFYAKNQREVTSPVENRFKKNGFDSAFNVLLDRYAPPSIIVNDQMDVVHVFGDAGKFLTPKPGKPEFNLRNLVDEKVATATSVTIQRAKKERERVAYKGIKVSKNKESRDIFVEPLGGGGASALYLVVFESKIENNKNLTTKEVKSTDSTLEHVAVLESELQNTKMNLQSTIEELETTNEELQSTNEELLASNEELQSTNEELHSVNEELYTVNSEYQKKINELTQLGLDEESLLRASKIGVIFLDAKLNIRKFTESVSETFNLMPQDIGRPLDHITNSIQVETLMEKIKQVQEEGESLELEVNKANGSCFLLRILPFCELNTTNGVILTFTDVSSLKNFQVKLEQNEILLREKTTTAMNLAQEAEHSRGLLEVKTQELKRSNEDLEQYAYVTSHDLQTPLRHLSTYTQALKAHCELSEDEVIAECVAGIMASCKRMGIMIRDLLELSTLGKDSIDIIEIDLKTRVDDVKGTLKERISDAKAEITCEPGIKIKVDNSLIDQLLQNLIENALKFKRSDVSPKIEIGCKEYEGEWCVSVKDNGIGIDTDSQGKVFQIFQRLHSVEKYAGTGIGLAICRRIMILHGGRIWVESNKGEGATFFMAFPKNHLELQGPASIAAVEQRKH